MGIPVEIVGEGTDWPAWVQAIGSVIAIFAAIIIDRGSARRALRADERRAAAAKLDWEAALMAAQRIFGNLHLSLGLVSRPDMDEVEVQRLIGNAARLLESYIRTSPPNADLALYMAAARQQIAEPERDIEALRGMSETLRARSYSRHIGAVDKVRFSVALCAEGLQRLREEYSVGM